MARDLVDAFWPGALTIIVEHAPSLKWDLGDLDGTVAVRMPLHPVALEVLREIGPMAVSSANKTGEPAATTAAEARDQLGYSVSVYLESGPTSDSLPSAIVDVTGDLPRLLRAGAIPLEKLREVVPTPLGPGESRCPRSRCCTCAWATSAARRWPNGCCCSRWPRRPAPGEAGARAQRRYRGWHAGEAMNPPAAREVRRRGADATGFTARQLRGEHLDGSDLILTATAEQVEYVLALRPDAASRTFVLGEFGRLLAEVDRSALPPVGPAAEAVYARGVALVSLADAARDGKPALPQDDLDDPWGRGDAFFARVADEIDQTVRPLAAALLDR